VDQFPGADDGAARECVGSVPVLVIVMYPPATLDAGGTSRVQTWLILMAPTTYSCASAAPVMMKSAMATEMPITYSIVF
jgi:hypothetical protein